MSWWARLRSPRRSGLAQQGRLAALPAPQPAAECLLARDRLVVLDLETTGLDVRRDRILSVGAVVIEGGAVDLAQAFERTVRRSGAGVLTNVLIHGLTPNRLAGGEAEDEVLIALLEFIAGAPVLAFHAPFDKAMLRRSLRREFGYRLPQPFLDVAPLALALAPGEPPRPPDLDLWLERYGLRVAERHNAAADALATAELLLILLRYARDRQLTTLADLQQFLLRHGRLANLQPFG